HGGREYPGRGLDGGDHQAVGPALWPGALDVAGAPGPRLEPGLRAGRPDPGLRRPGRLPEAVAHGDGTGAVRAARRYAPHPRAVLPRRADALCRHRTSEREWPGHGPGVAGRPGEAVTNAGRAVPHFIVAPSPRGTRRSSSPPRRCGCWSWAGCSTG